MDLYTVVILITILFSIITISYITTNRLITKETKLKAVSVCLLIAISALGEWIGVRTNGASAALILPHKLAKLVEFSAAPAIGVAVAMAYGEVKRPNIAIALAVAHALFECVALRFGWIFSVDAQNIYHREALYWIYVAAFVSSILYSLAGVVRSGKAYQVGIDSVLIWTLIMLVVGIGIQFIYSSIRIDYLCISIANMLFSIRYDKTLLQVDLVTRLLNRRCYDVNITEMGSRAAILFFDVDKFKQVNDTYGHSVGDICLRNVAQQLRSVYGKQGLCYRVGGDEFCVILRDDIENLEELNDRFAAAIRALRANDSRMPGVSMGYAYYDSASSHIRNAVEEADAMLYRNKSAL